MNQEGRHCTSTVEPRYIEHSGETEIASIWWEFVYMSERLLRQIRPKGNEKLFDIAGIDIAEFDCIILNVRIQTSSLSRDD